MSEQAIIVAPYKANESRGELTALEKKDGEWRKAFGPIAVTAGKNGFAAPGEKSEGDGKTPCGIFALGTAFGYAPGVETGLPYRQCTVRDFWVDDVDSPQYNTWVHGGQPAGSCERMLREDQLYKYGIVIEYNTNPVISGKGSAIFIHVWRRPQAPTQGCIAMAEQDLLRLLAWLDPVCQPVISIGGEAEEYRLAPQYSLA